MKIKAIIIDDEPKGRSNLRELLSEYCKQIEVIGEASSAAEALKVIVQKQPELLFLDIEMPGGSGFDLLKAMDKQDFEVIFVTAFDKYGIQAIKFCAIDYILKPIDIFELAWSVEKARAQIARKKDNLRLMELVANIDRNEEDRRIAFPLSDKIEFVPVNRIIRLEADGNYTHVYLDGKRQLMVCKTLKEYNDLLENYGFLRTHQSHLINCRKVAAFIKTDGGYISMEDGSSVPISRQRRDEVIKRVIR